jgi:hypothetical protein
MTGSKVNKKPKRARFNKPITFKIKQPSQRCTFAATHKLKVLLLFEHNLLTTCKLQMKKLFVIRFAFRAEEEDDLLYLTVINKQFEE